MHLLVWSMKTTADTAVDGLIDHWAAYDTYPEVKAAYDALLEYPELYSASICTVVESTDYSPNIPTI